MTTLKSVLLKITLLTCASLMCQMSDVKATSFMCQNNDSKIFSTPPKVPHQTLTSFFLKDFDEIIIIGDVHGCYDEQQLLLEKAEALTDNVLKIFAGDITRKGPENLKTLRYIKNCKSCLIVRGNHDDKTLLKYYQYKDRGFKYSVRDKWMNDLTENDIDWLSEIPYTISIPSSNATVVHAGLIPGVPLEQTIPFTLMNIRDVAAQPNCPGGWRAIQNKGSNIYKGESYAWAAKWNGPQHVYFGHDHKRKLQIYPFATGLDTSCVNGHYLTGVFIMGPRDGSFVTYKALHRYYPRKGY